MWIGFMNNPNSQKLFQLISWWFVSESKPVFFLHKKRTEKLIEIKLVFSFFLSSYISYSKVVLHLYLCFEIMCWYYYLFRFNFVFPNQFYWFPRDGSSRRISPLPSRYPRFFSPPPWKSIEINIGLTIDTPLLYWYAVVMLSETCIAGYISSGL